MSSYYFLLDNCKKTGVVFDHLISSIDVVNCQSVKIQVSFLVLCSNMYVCVKFYNLYQNSVNVCLVTG